MAIDLSEHVLHASHDLIITQEGNELTIWQIEDTRLVRPDDEEDIVNALRSEIRLAEDVMMVMDEKTGYTRIYHPHLSLRVFRDVDEIVQMILEELAA